MSVLLVRDFAKVQTETQQLRDLKVLTLLFTSRHPEGSMRRGRRSMQMQGSARLCE